jgi:hypothetical protein
VYDPAIFLYILKQYGRMTTPEKTMKEFLVSEGAIVAFINLQGGGRYSPPCMGAVEVINSAVGDNYQGKGVGKLAYRLAIVATPHPIMSDRSSVSPQARKVWKSMERDPEIETLPPTDPPYTGVFDDEEDPITEPKDDDCDIQKGGGTSLNKAYDLKDESAIKRLLKVLQDNHQTFMGKMNELQDQLYYASMITDSFLSDCGRTLFATVYAD